MKFSLIIISITILVSSCDQTMKLSNEDIQLIDELGFERKLMNDIRTYTDNQFSMKIVNPDVKWIFEDSTNYESFMQKNLRGMKFNDSETNALLAVLKLREEFIQNGYYIYISETNFGFDQDEVTILKTENKFDLLRFEGTSGINYDLSIEDIIRKLKKWDEKYGLVLIAVGYDFVEADFKKLPENIDEYSKELYEFCPDIVDQGIGTIDALKQELSKSKSLYLWWD